MVGLSSRHPPWRRHPPRQRHPPAPGWCSRCCERCQPHAPSSGLFLGTRSTNPHDARMDAPGCSAFPRCDSLLSISAELRMHQSPLGAAPPDAPPGSNTGSYPLCRALVSPGEAGSCCIWFANSRLRQGDYGWQVSVARAERFVKSCLAGGRGGTCIG